MAGIINLSDAAAIGLHALILMASEPKRVMATREVAAALKVSEAHLAKVLQRLTREGLVQSVRGPKGGFLLTRAPSRIRLLEIYEAIDGKLRPTHCLLGLPVCVGHQCAFRDITEGIYNKILDRFTSTSLADLQGVLTLPA